ncbi:helix-turn-helix domain-containing protein [Ruegeria arenilitoris]|uniref:helix-turn-helix domain-containing protein n=1 Tax=Ruegeria arenilitoris TaxID=1173585 RepID=UPI00147B9C4C|nr:helix-turn-helix transcriptional regulator [Ruegeria arenilitoris]
MTRAEFSAELQALGAKIREKRSVAGLSQEGLADACGLDRTYVGGVERGERNLGFVNLLRIAKALEVDPSDLLTGIRAGSGE